MKAVIIGGVAGGATAAARLRRLNETTEIVLLEKGPYISYANCGLPYYIGGTITDKRELIINTPESFQARYNVDVRVGHEVIRVDPVCKIIRVKNLASGEEYSEGYDKLLLSPGARPVVPALPGVGNERIFTLRTVPDTFAIREFILRKDPKRAVVVGGGYIGLEMVENLKAMGIAVTVIEAAGQVLSPLDAEMAQSVVDYLADEGVQVRTNCPVKGFEPDGDCLRVLVEDDGIPADLVLLSVGVKPDTAFLQSCGLAMNERGAIRVDEHMQTSCKDIYAVGDAVELRHFVTGEPGWVPLAGPANRQGRIAADNMAGKHSVYGGAQGSAIAKIFDLTVASTGINEKTAKSMGLRYEKVYLTAASHAGYYPGGHNMNIKLLFKTPSGRILGTQIVGFEGVDKRCDVIATAMRAGITAAELAELELCYAPPFSGAKDPVNMVGYVAENVLTGKVKQYFWQDLENLPKDGSVTLLDVRSHPEVKRGGMPGAVWIPLNELRARMGELDKAKPIYVTCQSGLRSYIACRILGQYGFDSYNFAGGYGLYKKIRKDK